MVPVHFTIERSTLERIDREAKANRRTRSSQLRLLLDEATRAGGR